MAKFNKAWMAFLPLAVMIGAKLGFDITTDWWVAAGATIAPLAVYWIPNKE